MGKNTKALTRGALSAALSVVFMYLAAVVPTGSLTFMAMAGLVPAISVIDDGIGWGLGVYAVTALLSALVVPTKGCVVFYIMMFGHYPVVKSLIERAPKRIIEWLMKLAVFNLLLTVMTVALKSMFMEAVNLTTTVTWAVYLIGNAAFVLYDIAFSKLIIVYNNKWRKK